MTVSVEGPDACYCYCTLSLLLCTVRILLLSVPVEGLDELHLADELPCTVGARDLAGAVPLPGDHLALQNQQQVRDQLPSASDHAESGLKSGGLENISELLGWFKQPFSPCKTCYNNKSELSPAHGHEEQGHAYKLQSVESFRFFVRPCGIAATYLRRICSPGVKNITLVILCSFWTSWCENVFSPKRSTSRIQCFSFANSCSRKTALLHCSNSSAPWCTAIVLCSLRYAALPHSWYSLRPRSGCTQQGGMLH
eukprot:561695-Pyramimonas_sp.AAC.1